MGPGSRSYLGARVPRLEDDRLLAGRGAYVGDLRLPGMVEVAIVRSTVAHARVESVGLDRARSLPGVIGAFTAADLVDVSPFPDFFPHARPVRQFPLARDRVRYVGAPVAAVVAEDRYRAEDSAEEVEVGYHELPAVASVEAALAPDAPRLYEDWPDNRMVEVAASRPEVDRAFAGAARVIRGTYRVGRHAAVPMEPRGAVAEFRHGRLTLWTSTQFPHIVRTTLARMLAMGEADVRVVAPDVGGGFGCKAQVYPEEVLVCWLARRLGRPVRWVEDRAEHLVATCHARDEVVDLEAAVDREGRIVALRGAILQDLGSGEMFPGGFAPSFVLAGSLTGPYRIPHQALSITGVVTNKTPSGAYRGFGVPEAAFAMERLVDRVAREVGDHPLEVRRRMLLDPEDLPYTTASGARLDSGSHRAAFERVVEAGRAALEEARERAERAAPREPGGGRPRRRLGLGVANYVEGVVPSYFPTSGHWGAQDSCTLRFDPDGSVEVGVGVSPAGQGLATMVATVTAEALGLPLEAVRVVMGDTEAAPYGLGGWGSRSTGVAAGAILRAASALRDKGVRIAAHLLEASPADLEVGGGRIAVRGAEQRAVTWARVAQTAIVRTVDLPPGEEPGLEAFAVFDPPVDHVPRADGGMNACATYTNATHAAVVAVDPDTGEVTVLKYLVAHDCGTVINPVIVEGQVQGGVAQGLGGTLLEDLPYSADGQPLAASFLDYLVPTAAEVPPIAVEHFESPAPDMALGAKGAGEAGIVGPAAAIAQAVEDALSDLGVPEVDATPLTPALLRSLVRRAGRGGGEGAG